jgi:hypothetical protein
MLSISDFATTFSVFKLRISDFLCVISIFIVVFAFLS